VNFFLTGIGERYLNVNFGSGLRNLLFEQLTQDKIEEVREIVTSGLEIYFPRVIPTLIEVKGSPDSNSVNFFMSYAIQDSNIEDELLINFAI
jgi:phage baseplate assembly protein W